MEQRELGLAMAGLCADKAEQTTAFSVEAAQKFVVSWLEQHGATRGEDLVIAAKAAGHVGHDDRCYGAVFAGLSRIGLIKTVGFCERVRGHGTAGGRIWDLVSL